MVYTCRSVIWTVGIGLSDQYGILNLCRLLLSNVPFFINKLDGESCTITAQSSRVGCSRRVHRKVYLAVKNGHI